MYAVFFFFYSPISCHFYFHVKVCGKCVRYQRAPPSLPLAKVHTNKMLLAGTQPANTPKGAVKRVQRQSTRFLYRPPFASKSNFCPKVSPLSMLPSLARWKAHGGSSIFSQCHQSDRFSVISLLVRFPRATTPCHTPAEAADGI